MRNTKGPGFDPQLHCLESLPFSLNGAKCCLSLREAICKGLACVKVVSKEMVALVEVWVLKVHDDLVHCTILVGRNVCASGVQLELAYVHSVRITRGQTFGTRILCGS